MNIYLEYTPNHYKARTYGFLSKFDHIESIHVIFDKKVNYYAFKAIFGDFSKNIIFDVKNPTNLKKLVKITNRKKHHPTIHIIIEKELTNKDKKTLDKLHSIFLIEDLTLSRSNHEYYLKNKYVIYSDYEDNLILKSDLKYQHYFNELRWQCINSHCIKNTFYLSKDDAVSFCPHHPQETIVGHINDDFINHPKLNEMKERQPSIPCPFMYMKDFEKVISSLDFSKPIDMNTARIDDQIIELKRISYTQANK